MSESQPDFKLDGDGYQAVVQNHRQKKVGFIHRLLVKYSGGLVTNKNVNQVMIVLLVLLLLATFVLLSSMDEDEFDSIQDPATGNALPGEV